MIVYSLNCKIIHVERVYSTIKLYVLTVNANVYTNNDVSLCDRIILYKLVLIINAYGLTHNI